MAEPNSLALSGTYEDEMLMLAKSGLERSASVASAGDNSNEPAGLSASEWSVAPAASGVPFRAPGGPPAAWPVDLGAAALSPAGIAGGLTAALTVVSTTASASVGVVGA